MGSHGMPRRYYDYLPQFQPYHRLSTIGAYVLAVGFVIIAVYLLHSLFRGRPAPANPWGGATAGVADAPRRRRTTTSRRRRRSATRTTSSGWSYDRDDRRVRAQDAGRAAGGIVGGGHGGTDERGRGVPSTRSAPGAPLRHAEQQFESGKLGMWLFLATEILLFGGLFCAYAVYRANHPEIFVYAHHFLDKTLGGDQHRWS